LSEWLLLVAILTIAAVLVLLTVLILVMKAIRQARLAHLARKRREIEPGLLKYLAAREGVLEKFVSVPPRGDTRTAAIALLIEHADLLKGEARERITTALERIGMVGEEMAHLDSSSAWKRAMAAERLGLARSVSAVDALARRMEDSDPEVQLRAARALGQIRGRLAVRPLIEALANPSRWSTLRVADILSTMGGEAAEELIRSFPQLTPQGKVACLDILGRLRRPDTAAFIQQRLKDENPDVRARAAHALGQIGDPTTWQALSEALKDPEWPVRAMAAKALGRLHAPQSVGSLAEGLRDRQWWVRSNAAEALSGMGEGGTQALIDLLDSPDDYARHQAVLMLQQSGIVDQYADRLDGLDLEAARARRVVGKIVEVGQVQRLDDLARNHTSPSVRAALADLLGKAAAGRA